MFDTDIDNLVAVVGQDDVDQILADVVHVALDGGQHDPALTTGTGRLHVRFQVRHSGFHDLGRLKHERQLHLSRTEQHTNSFHAGQQCLVDDLQRRHLDHRLIEVGLEAVTLAVDDASLQPFEQWQLSQFRRPRFTCRRRRHPFEQLHQLLQRIIGVGAPVVDQIEGDRAVLLGDARHRQDLGGVHDGRVESGLHTFVQEHRIEHLPGGRVQAEGDVGDAQGEVDARVSFLDPPDGLDCLDAVAAHLLLPGRDREGEGIDDDVLLRQPPVVGDLGDQPLGDRHLVVGGAGLPFLVDGQRHHCGTVFDDQPHDARKPRIGTVAVLVVDRVHCAPAAECFQTGLDDVGFGGVDHDRQCRGRREAGGQSRHVGGAVAAHVVDVEVEHVGAVAGLVLGGVQALLVVAGDHRLAERLGAVGVGAFADHQEARVLVERHRRVQRRRLGLMLGRAHRGGDLGDGLRHLPDVFGCGSAAAAHEFQTEPADEAAQGLGQLVRRQRVFSTVGAQHGQPRVRHHRHRDPGMLGQVPQVLAHLGGAGGAVQADHVDAEWFDRGQRRPDLRTEQHGAGGFDGHMGDDRDGPAQLCHRPTGRDHRGLHLQQVLAGLDEDRVGAAVEHAGHAFEVGVADDLERGVAQARQFGPGPDGTEHETGGAVGRGTHLVGDAAGDGGALVGQFADAVRDVVVTEVGQVAAECVGFDGVGAGLEVGSVDIGEYVGPGVVEDLVTAFEAVEIVKGQICGLEHRAHRTVADQHPAGHGRQEG